MILVWTYFNSFNMSFMNGDLGYFQYFATVNNVTINNLK